MDWLEWAAFELGCLALCFLGVGLVVGVALSSLAFFWLR